MKIVQARLAAKAAGIESLVFAPQLNPHAALAKRPLTELSKEYETRIAEKKYKTRRGYMNAVNRFVGFMAAATLGDCDRDAMIRYRQHLVRTLDSASYVFNTFLKTVMFLNDVGIRKLFSEDDWLRHKDWPPNVDKKENGTKRYDTYTRDEIAALLSVADTRERALVLFLVSTGFRISEARDTTWALVDFRTNEVLAPGTQTKDKQSRFEPLAAEAVAALKAWKEVQMKNGIDSPYVFPAPLGGRDFHLTERTVVPLIGRATRRDSRCGDPRNRATGCGWPMRRCCRRTGPM